MIDYKAIMADMERRAEEALEWMLESTREYTEEPDYENAFVRAVTTTQALEWAESVPLVVAPMPSLEVLWGMARETTDEHGNPWGSALAFARHKLTNYDALLHMSGAYPCDPDDTPDLRNILHTRVNSAIIAQVPELAGR